MGLQPMTHCLAQGMMGKSLRKLHFSSDAMGRETLEVRTNRRQKKTGTQNSIPSKTILRQ